MKGGGVTHLKHHLARRDDGDEEEEKDDDDEEMSEYVNIDDDDDTEQRAFNMATSPYYKIMIDEIAKARKGVRGLTPYEIMGRFLDEEVEELKRHFKKAKLYRLTIICDGWTRLTRLSIINFMVYCNGQTMFHKSINASSDRHNAWYLFSLMNAVVDEVGAENVVQVVTDNGSAYKAAGRMLKRKRKHLYWTPYPAHCLDLMLEDIAKLSMVSRVIERGKTITNFIYNYSIVLNLMRSFTNNRELIRLGPTRFATHYIALKSLNSQNTALRRMIDADEWKSLPQARTKRGEEVKKIINDNNFWKLVQQYALMTEPLVKMLRIVDGEKRTTMGIIYEAMHRVKKMIEDKFPNSNKHILYIINKRWNAQLVQHLHKAVITRLELDETRAAIALQE
ncbi:PREDICTED: uncharacterized protein LOC104590993, partial [Nelumbo nucifera]|uniref:Uncharacterized protein LOC104590993 n=1 Tax=Nelumbo nucifera TaxID=4432 RepID=A0A1U7ZIG7_NELNU